MTTSPTLKTFPQGRLSIGTGDLFDVTNVSFSTTSGKKLIQTLRQRPAGTCIGAIETTLTFEAPISELGEEADWLKLTVTTQFINMRFKFPGRTINFVGDVSESKYDASVDDATKASVTIIGKITT